MALIACAGLTKVYGEGDSATHALRGVDCEIDAGEFVAIMGPSGSGKSTLMHILGLLDRPTAGRYLFEDEDITAFDDTRIAHMRNQKVGFVFQAFNLLPRLTVAENVALPEQYNFYTKEHTGVDRVAEVLKIVSLTHRTEHFPTQLSGGEKQRAAIARALMNNPSVIFADEPTGNLDSKSGLDVMRALQMLHAEGHTIILVTHERTTAEHAQRIIYMRDGCIESQERIAAPRQAAAAAELLK